MTETRADGGFGGEYYGTVNAPGYRFTFRQEAMEVPEALKRAFAQLMVVFMPAGGLPETLDSLKNAFEFHRENEQRALPAPERSRIVHGHVTTKKLRDEMGLGD